MSPQFGFFRYKVKSLDKMVCKLQKVSGTAMSWTPGVMKAHHPDMVHCFRILLSMWGLINVPLTSQIWKTKRQFSPSSKIPTSSYQSQRGAAGVGRTEELTAAECGSHPSGNPKLRVVRSPQDPQGQLNTEEDLDRFVLGSVDKEHWQDRDKSSISKLQNGSVRL